MQMFRNICKNSLIKLCDLRLIRQYLTDESAVLSANVLVGSPVDYCNSFFKCLLDVQSTVHQEYFYMDCHYP